MKLFKELNRGDYFIWSDGVWRKLDKESAERAEERHGKLTYPYVKCWFDDLDEVIDFELNKEDKE